MAKKELSMKMCPFVSRETITREIRLDSEGKVVKERETPSTQERECLKKGCELYDEKRERCSLPLALIATEKVEKRGEAITQAGLEQRDLLTNLSRKLDELRDSSFPKLIEEGATKLLNELYLLESSGEKTAGGVSRSAERLKELVEQYKETSDRILASLGEIASSIRGAETEIVKKFGLLSEQAESGFKALEEHAEGGLKALGEQMAGGSEALGEQFKALGEQMAGGSEALVEQFKALGEQMAGGSEALVEQFKALGEQMAGGFRALGEKTDGDLKALGERTEGGLKLLGEQAEKSSKLLREKVEGGFKSLSESLKLVCSDLKTVGTEQKTSLEGALSRISGLFEEEAKLVKDVDQRLSDAVVGIQSFVDLEKKRDKKMDEVLKGIGDSVGKIGEFLKEEKERKREEEESKRLKTARDHNDRGVSLYYRGAFEAAVRELEKAIELNPNQAESYNNLGLTYSRLSKAEEAISNFSKAIELNPDFAEAYNNLGLLYYKKAEYQEAVDLFSHALQKREKYAVAYTNLGNALHQQKRFEEANKSWQRALEIDPGCEEARKAIELYKEGRVDGGHPEKNQKP